MIDICNNGSVSPIESLICAMYFVWEDGALCNIVHKDFQQNVKIFNIKQGNLKFW